MVAFGCTVGPSGDTGFASSQTGATSPTAPSSGGDGTADGGSEGGAEAGGDATMETGSTEPTSASGSEGETSSTAGDGGEGSAGSSGGSESTGNNVDGTPLDPNLDTPDDGQSCETPGSTTECPFLEVCRFYTAEESKCEGCDECGNLNAPCVDGTDCDILFACYSGRCTNICPLGTPYCGPIEDCLDVGHASHGVCDPFA